MCSKNIMTKNGKQLVIKKNCEMEKKNGKQFMMKKNHCDKTQKLKL